jgi:hypothetical protein
VRFGAIRSGDRFVSDVRSRILIMRSLQLAKVAGGKRRSRPRLFSGPPG